MVNREASKSIINSQIKQKEASPCMLHESLIVLISETTRKCHNFSFNLWIIKSSQSLSKQTLLKLLIETQIPKLGSLKPKGSFIFNDMKNSKGKPSKINYINWFKFEKKNISKLMNNTSKILVYNLLFSL